MPKAVPRQPTLHPVLRTLRVERLLRHETMRDVESSGDFSDSTVSNIETGKPNLRFATVVAYAESLGFEVCLRPTGRSAIAEANHTLTRARSNA